MRWSVPASGEVTAEVAAAPDQVWDGAERPHPDRRVEPRVPHGRVAGRPRPTGRRREVPGAQPERPDALGARLHDHRARAGAPARLPDLRRLPAGLHRVALPADARRRRRHPDHPVVPDHRDAEVPRADDRVLHAGAPRSPCRPGRRPGPAGRASPGGCRRSPEPSGQAETSSTLDDTRPSVDGVPLPGQAPPRRQGRRPLARGGGAGDRSRRRTSWACAGSRRSTASRSSSTPPPGSSRPRRPAPPTSTRPSRTRRSRRSSPASAATTRSRSSGTSTPR